MGFGIDYNVTLDLIKNNYVSIRVKQNDSLARKIILKITKNGELYKIENDIKAIVQMKRPDGKTIAENCTIDRINNIVEVALKNTMLLAHGVGVLEIVLIKYSTEEVLSSMNLNVIIERGAITKKDVIENIQWETLSDLIFQVNSFMQSMSSKMVDLTNLENEIKNNEVVRANKEAERNNNESTRIKNEQSRIEEENQRKQNEIDRINEHNNRLNELTPS